MKPPSSRLPSALGRQHQVLDAHVGEGAAHHDLVVAAARAVAVEVGLQHAVVEQVRPAGRAVLEAAGRRDVVGRDAVAEQRHDARALHAGDQRRRRHREVLEEGRLGDVGAVGPGVDVAGHALDLLPQRAGLGLHLLVVAAEGRAVHRVLHQRVHLVAGRPDVAQVDVAPALAAGRPARVIRSVITLPAIA